MNKSSKVNKVNSVILLVVGAAVAAMGMLLLPSDYIATSQWGPGNESLYWQCMSVVGVGLTGATIGLLRLAKQSNRINQSDSNEDKV